MFLLNLSLGQFLALFGSASAVVVALYLFDRSRRRQVVATLRFWVAAEEPVTAVRRRSIQQRMSLLLQLVSIALLLLAIAQLRWGARGAVPFDHILILDTSAWMGARAPAVRGRPAGRTLMDEARARARAYVRALPAGDRIMLVRADALPTAATGFETDRLKLEGAIAASRPGSTALNLEQAFDFARQVGRLSARRSGEIAFAGAGRISEREGASTAGVPAARLRVLPVADAVENCGLRKIGLRRQAHNPAVWEIFVSARNYGSKPQTVNLALQFGGAPAGSRQLSLPPGSEQEATFVYRTRAAGLLEARLLTRDAFPDDDRVVIELPQQKTLPVAVYSDDPETLRPILEADSRVEAVFRPTAQYQPKSDAALVILDRFAPASPPVVDSIWIDPPAQGSPLPLHRRMEGVRFTRWHTGHPVGAGLRTRDLVLDSGAVLEPGKNDIPIAECEQGPLVVARPGKPKMLVLGFHPTRSALRYELAAPLLFANTLRWMAPDVFRRWELTGGSAGTVNTALDPEIQPGDIQVRHEDGRPLPFTLRERSLHFFSGDPGTVRVTAADREMVYSLTLPELGETKWEPPAGVLTGLPSRGGGAAAAADLWQVLACLGALGLLVEWAIWGRYARGARPPRMRIPRRQAA
ncbi:MAG: VWA domain-containing protein [Candidatus Solibacter usitatus]|nr:VWA domain-containing protein [Candidatus Solibacter usitatus]